MDEANDELQEGYIQAEEYIWMIFKIFNIFCLRFKNRQVRQVKLQLFNTTNNAPRLL